jgi:FAD/FMN-containing dehydrogenase
MMDNLAIRAAEDFIHAGYPTDAAAILLCEVDGAERDVQEDCERVDALLRFSKRLSRSMDIVLLRQDAILKNAGGRSAAWQNLSTD